MKVELVISGNRTRVKIHKDTHEESMTYQTVNIRSLLFGSSQQLGSYNSMKLRKSTPTTVEVYVWGRLIVTADLSDLIEQFSIQTLLD